MSLKFLQHGGKMGEAIAAFPWADTPLGPLEEWGPVLKSTVATMLASHFPKSLAWGPELISIHNDAFCPILGDKPEALGRPFSEVWAETWPTIGPIVAKALEGEATFIEDLELTVDRGRGPEQAWFTFCYSPVRNEQGQVLGMLDTVIETTGKVQAQRQARLLNRELSHRMKNVLTVVQAIANQTFRLANSIAQGQKSFDQRLAALGRAHDVLTEDEWSTAPIDEVVERALAPHVAPEMAVSMSGPPVNLPGRQALALGLAVHEMATNAMKYGALCSQHGRVTIEWEAGAPRSDEPFVFRWSEHDGPPCTPPKREGFGSKLIRQVFPKQFGGQATLDYPAEGFRCELRTRMRSLQPPAGGSRNGAAPQPPAS